MLPTRPRSLDVLLAVHDLTVCYASSGVALDGVSFEIAEGEAVGLLGRSGSGKSTLARAILGLLPPGGWTSGGTLELRGRPLDRLDEGRWLAIRGAEIGLVFQEPILALHPTRRVGDQIADVLQAHRRWGRRRCRAEAEELLREVGLPASEVGGAFPHQLSGGQRQRVVLAQAVACRPALIVADEPTAALDSVSEAQVLELLSRLRTRLRLALLVISHDPRVLARVADRLLVLRAGRLVDDGPLERVLRKPADADIASLLTFSPAPLAPP